MDKKKINYRTHHSIEEELKAQPEFDQGKLHSAYTVAFLDQQFLLRDELRPVRLQLELLRPELVLQDFDINDTFVFFGSSKLPPLDDAKKALSAAEAELENDPTDQHLQRQLEKAKRIAENSTYLSQATKLASMVSTHKHSEFYVVTGGGPSFMEAANKGAHDVGAKSLALNMMLPNEQHPNQYVTPQLTFQFHYFAIRKMHFLMRAKALAAFPGGFGTMDELFEALTLIQTKKIQPIPLLLFNKNFWQRVVSFEDLVLEGTIRESDLELFHYVETAEEAWQIVKDFYQLKD